MPDLPDTPSRPARPTRADGLMVQLAKGGSRKTSIARLKAVVAAELSGRWRVEPISHGDRLYELIRIRPVTQPTIRQAFDMARILEAHDDIALAEVGAIVPGADPDLSQVRGGARARSTIGGGDDGHRRCSHSEEWALAETCVQAAWALPLPIGGRPQGESIVVGHPDTGYTKHPEYFDSDRVLVDRGYDFEDNKKHPLDPLKGWAPGHGTATGSVIMGTVGDQSPALPHYVTGVAPRAKLIPVRISTGVVHLSFRRLVRAIYHCIEQRVAVISLSLGGPIYSSVLDIAIKAAVSRGIVVIAAAGNVWPWVVYPAKFDQVIAVAASNCRRRAWEDSAGGAAVDVAAPGESVWRARARQSRSGRFANERSSGTSYATAITAGACALWLAYHGRRTLIEKYGKEHLSDAFRHLLVATVDVPPRWKKSKHGAGVVDAKALLSAKLPGKAAVLRARPKPKRPSSLSAVSEMLPEASGSGSKITLAKLFRCLPRDLPAELAPFRQEFCFLMATNPEFRRALARGASATRPRGVSRRVLGRANMLGGKTSRGLAKRLGLDSR